MMNSISKSNVMNKYLVFTLFFTAIMVLGLTARSSYVFGNEKQEEFRKIFADVKTAVQIKDFSKLRKYARKNDALYWGQCNTDTSINLSFKKIIHELKENSKDANILATENLTGRLTGMVETIGWTGEYPYLYFQFSKVDKNWKWLGVCYDMARSLDYRLFLGGKEKYYDSPPKLPRQDPRVFKDVTPLHSRIAEILKFKAFEALKPYATRGKLFVGKSCPDIADSTSLITSGVPVNQVVEFLVKNSAGAKEIVPGEGYSFKSNYFLSRGWTGEKPEVIFCFAEGKGGWEWVGITY